MKTGIPLFLLLITLHSAFTQPLGIINNASEEVVVRSGRDLAYVVEGRIREGQKFRFWPEDDQDWWYVESENEMIKGYAPKKFIQYYYPSPVSTNCKCLGDYESRPLINFRMADQEIAVCGGLLQRKKEDFIIARRFGVQHCGNESNLVKFGPLETCFIFRKDDELVIQSVKKLPIGRNWIPTRVPITEARVAFKNGMFVTTDRKLVVQVVIPPLQVETFISELETMKGKGQGNGVDYGRIMDKLLSSSLAGSNEASEILRSIDDYFGFDLVVQYQSRYYGATALLDAVQNN